MIRLVALYPNKAGARFDLKYYTETHMKLVEEKLKPFGLLRIEVDKGVSGLNADAPAPFVVVGMVTFNSLEDCRKGMAAHGEELLADIPNYTDIEPQIQINEVVL
jgi:uncharacterized protein (TIGR02118 family)